MTHSYSPLSSVAASLIGLMPGRANRLGSHDSKFDLWGDIGEVLADYPMYSPDRRNKSIKPHYEVQADELSKL